MKKYQRSIARWNLNENKAMRLEGFFSCLQNTFKMNYLFQQEIILLLKTPCRILITSQLNELH